MQSKIIFSNQSGMKGLPKVAFIKQCVLETLRHENKVGEISLAFIDNDTMQKLNTDYRQKAYATNVLSFPAEAMFKQPFPFLGDILVCPLVAKNEAVAQNKAFDAHLAHLLVHGTLHLLGYDHEIEAEALVMEQLEIKILHILHYPNPYDRGSREQRN